MNLRPGATVRNRRFLEPDNRGPAAARPGVNDLDAAPGRPTDQSGAPGIETVDNQKAECSAPGRVTR